MVAVLFAALSGLSYGAADFSGGLATKRNDATVVTLAMQIVSLASLGVVLVALPRGELIPADLAWGAVAGLAVALALSTFYQALAEGPMSTAASVTALVGAILPVGCGLALGEIPNRPTLVGIGLAVPAGIAVSAGGVARLVAGRELSARSRLRSRAQIRKTRRLSLVAGFGFGSFFVALAQTSGDGGLHPLLGARLASITALTLAVAWVRRPGAARDGARTGSPEAGDLVAVMVAGVLDCAANSLYLLALDGGSFTWVAAVVSLYPVATVLLARLLLQERIAPIQVGGLVVAASALVLVGVGAA